MRKKRVLPFAGIAGVVASACALAAVAPVAAAAPEPVYQPPLGYYLALGDSIAYGIQPARVKPGARPSDFTGYVDVFAARLRALAPGLEVVNYGCPGESTVTFARGRCPARADGVELHDAYRGAQLKAALSFLRAHPGQVSPITLTLWGNDLFPLSAKGTRAPGAIASFASRLGGILKRLRAAAPDAEIIVTGAWNPEPDRFARAAPLYRALDAAIERAATESGARVADMFAAFNGPGTVRAQKRRLCALTFICAHGDPHPNDAGYRAMADAFLAASDYPDAP
jgi:lysophospholipase L1-like esterase